MKFVSRVRSAYTLHTPLCRGLRTLFSSQISLYRITEYIIIFVVLTKRLCIHYFLQTSLVKLTEYVCSSIIVQLVNERNYYI